MFNSTHFHPMLVHFPIALLTAGFLFDLFSMFLKKEPCLSKAGFWLEILGMAGALFAFGTGYFFTSPMEGDSGIMRDKHELFATLALISVIIAVLCRIAAIYLKKDSLMVRYALLGLFFFSVVLISITGFLGGSLVMDYMIGL